MQNTNLKTIVVDLITIRVIEVSKFRKNTDLLFLNNLNTVMTCNH